METLTGTQDWEVYSNLQGLQKLKGLSHKDEKTALKAVAKQFEALFLEMMLKQSQKVNFDDEGMMSSERTQFFQTWHYEQLAQDVASKGSIGLADQLVEQLTPKQPVVTPEQYQQLKQADQLPAAYALKLRQP